MKCGHKGKPNKSEEKLLENLLRDSEFIMPSPLRNKTEVKKEFEDKSSLIIENEGIMRNSALSENMSKNRIIQNMADEEDVNEVEIQLEYDSFEKHDHKVMEEFDSSHKKYTDTDIDRRNLKLTGVAKVHKKDRNHSQMIESLAHTKSVNVSHNNVDSEGVALYFKYQTIQEKNSLPVRTNTLI